MCASIRPCGSVRGAGGCRVRLRARVCVDAHARTRDHVCARQCGVTACASEAHVALRARACVRVWDRANRSPLDARRSEEHAEREALCVHARVYELERDRQRWLHAAYFCARAERPSVSTPSHVRALSPTSEGAALRLHARDRERALLLARPTRPPTHPPRSRMRACARARLRSGSATTAPRRTFMAKLYVSAAAMPPAHTPPMALRRFFLTQPMTPGSALGASPGRSPIPPAAHAGPHRDKRRGVKWGGGGGRATRAGSVVVCSGWSWGACARRAPAVAGGGPSGQLLPRAANSSLPSARQNACDRDEFTQTNPTLNIRMRCELVPPRRARVIPDSPQCII